MRRVLALALVAVVVAGCGGGEDDSPLTVFAAASLAGVFDRLDPHARFNFAGSDQLAAQLREGADADVFAAASARYAGELFEEGLVERPVTFATNRLVLIVASGSSHVASLQDLGRTGVKLVVGAEGVPVGDYTREVLERAGKSAVVLANVVSEEEDVRGVLAKIVIGEADAGFVYATDADAAGDDVRTIELPDGIQVPIRYQAAVVRDGDRRNDAEAFVRLLTSERGRDQLRRAGFGLP